MVDLLIKFNHLLRNRAQFPYRGDKWANNRVRTVGKTKRRTNSVFFFGGGGGRPFNWRLNTSV